MKRGALLLLLIAACAVATPASADRVGLLGFLGFDWQQTGPGGGPPPPFLQNAGDDYRAVGFVTQFGSLLAGSVNTTQNEYTWYLNNAFVAGSTYTGTVLEVLFQNDVRFSVYEDSRTTGTLADYGVSPANATSPSTFSDGTLALGADVDFLVLVYDYDPFVDQGNFDGTATLDSGTLLPLVPSGARSGWVVSGLAARPNNTIPDGYVDQLSGEIQIPGSTPTAHKSWGAIKALYR
jgi:hypothetical protein